MTYPSVVPAPPYRPALHCSLPTRPALFLSTSYYAPWIEMNRNEEEKSRNNPTIKNLTQFFFSPNANRFSLGRLTSIISSPGGQTLVNEKEGQKRCQRKHIKKITINQTWPFVIPNLGPVARNGDGGETKEGRQRETKRRDRKHENPAELTFYIIVVVASLLKMQTTMVVIAKNANSNGRFSDETKPEISRSNQ